MRKLIAKVNTAQRSGLNPKTLFVYENESGTVGYNYTNNQGEGFPERCFIPACNGVGSWSDERVVGALALPLPPQSSLTSGTCPS